MAIKVESFREVEEVFRSFSSSLLSLMIVNCSKLENVLSRGLELLTALEELFIRDCENLRLEDEDEEMSKEGIVKGISSRFLHHSLHTLTFRLLPQLVNLPDLIQFLPDLQSLRIEECIIIISINAELDARC